MSELYISVLRFLYTDTHKKYVKNIYRLNSIIRLFRLLLKKACLTAFTSEAPVKSAFFDVVQRVKGCPCQKGFPGAFRRPSECSIKKYIALLGVPPGSLKSWKAYRRPLGCLLSHKLRERPAAPVKRFPDRLA